MALVRTLEKNGHRQWHMYLGGLLLIVSIVAAWQAYDDGNEALAGVIGFVGTGFYSGNIYGSITSAHKYNKKKVADILSRHITIAPKVDAKNQSYSVSLKYRF